MRSALIFTVIAAAVIVEPALAVCTGYNLGSPECPKRPMTSQPKYHQGPYSPGPVDQPIVNDANGGNGSGNGAAVPYSPPQYQQQQYVPPPAMSNVCVVGPGAYCQWGPAPVTSGCYCSDGINNYPGQVQ